MATERWRAGASLAHELDLALSVALGAYFPGGGVMESAAALRDLPQAWRDDWHVHLGPLPPGWSLLEPLSLLAEVARSGSSDVWPVPETDYAALTLPLRSLAPEAARRALARWWGTPEGPVHDPDFAPQVARWLELHRRLDFQPSAGVDLAARLRLALQTLLRVLPGGDLHAWFWLWLDRFYYQCYAPLRAARAAELEVARQRVAAALGGVSGVVLPPLAWLPPQNPLHLRPTFTEAVDDGTLRLFFWIEPFGLPDTWSLLPGLLIVTTGEAGPILRGFQQTAAELAEGLSALADPTRLMILRLIRLFAMSNTEIAAFLELARPTVSIHAKVLRQAGLIRTETQGRAVRHELDADAVRALFAQLARLLELDD